MLAKKWIVNLSDEERAQLQQALKEGACGRRQLKRAHILLLADAGHPNRAIAVTVRVVSSTVARTCRRYVQGGLDHALSEMPHSKRRTLLHEEERPAPTVSRCNATAPSLQ